MDATFFPAIQILVALGGITGVHLAAFVIFGLIMLRKIDSVKNDLEAKITGVRTEITEVKAQIRELKTNDIAHVADGVSEIAFILKGHRVFSEDEAAHVKDLLQPRRSQESE
ncbi:MAG: hypothetical protein LBR38_02580 [Synergistaceae bacterium]|jgi:hypothetical protein|nr:hypothetical protein [Synergistaceae bacterium]